MLDKVTRGRKRLQVISDISSTTYKAVKMEDGDSSRLQKRMSKTAIWQKTQIEVL